MTASEFGGYLEFERFSGEPYHEGAVALNCGRGCLAYLAELRGMEAVWLPDFMCGSVSALFRREGVRTRTYRVSADMSPVCDFDVGPGEWMLLADYYGQLRAEDVERVRRRCGGRLVVDESQGFFRRPWPGVDTVYTCRKWFGVADGGYLFTGDGARLDRALPRDESHGRMGFVLGRLERPASEFLAESKGNNAFFADEPAKLMSPVTENVMRAVDYERAKARRDANWRIVHGALGDANLLDLREPDGAFMYPFMTHDAERLRSELIARKVYVPTLWPDVLRESDPSSAAHRLAHDVIPLPVDQRYGAEEMTAMAEVVRSCLSRTGRQNGDGRFER